MLAALGVLVVVTLAAGCASSDGTPAGDDAPPASDGAPGAPDAPPGDPCGDVTCGGFERCEQGACVPLPPCDGADTCDDPGAICRNDLCVPSDRDVDGDGAPASLDCDETRAEVNLGASEACNALDDDCDGVVDDGVGTPWYKDGDGDGYGAPATETIACTAPAGHVAQAGDCNDQRATQNPGAPEVCGDGLDDDCDQTADDGCVCPPQALETCVVTGCAFARRRCAPTGKAWGACTCACPGGGTFDGATQCLTPRTCPAGATLRPDGQCEQQVQTGWKCPQGGLPSGNRCYPDDTHPRTDVECALGGVVRQNNGRKVCCLDQDLGTTGENPVCDDFDGETYRFFNKSGWRICVTEEDDADCPGSTRMMYYANKIYGGAASDYPATPVTSIQVTPGTCPAGWTPTGASCAIAAALP